jgi:hypothetical protein
VTLRAKWFVGLTAVALAATPLHAQELRTQCDAASQPGVRAFCENVADAAVILQPRLGLAAAGGNPVPGTASTLGMRMGTLPRLSLGLRVSAADVDVPPVERQTSTRDVSFPIGSIAMDASIGLFQGFSLLPTVGGFGSVDALASAGIVPLPAGEGFDDSSPFTWAVGARLGILRESFTAPGVSVSAMHRRLGDVTYGSETLTDRDAYFRLTDYQVTSVRGTVGKRLLGFGLTGGAGWDRYSADVSGRVRDPRVLSPAFQLEITQRGLTQSRTSLFGNVAFTLVILNVSAELGWQQGGEPIEDATDRLQQRGVFGGLAIRVAL